MPLQVDNTPFLALFPVLRIFKTIGGVLQSAKQAARSEAETELQYLRGLDKFKYDPRLDNQTDLYHNFPHLFDKFIIDNAPWAQRIKDGANFFEYPGSVTQIDANGNPVIIEGNYQIGVNDQGVIFHRNFVPFK